MTKHREFLYDPETGRLWREASGASHRGYRTVQFQGQRHLVHRVAWFLYYGEWPMLPIDHTNGNPSDNRITNLRLATASENSFNRSRPSHNTSGFKGVSLQRSRWQALIRANGQNRFLGSFDTPEEASAAYNRAALEHHGKFARVDM